MCVHAHVSVECTDSVVVVSRTPDLSAFISPITFLILVQMMKASVFVCFVALRPKSTAIVMAGQSVHLTTLFLGQA